MTELREEAEPFVVVLHCFIKIFTVFFFFLFLGSWRGEELATRRQEERRIKRNCIFGGEGFGGRTVHGEVSKLDELFAGDVCD